MFLQLLGILDGFCIIAHILIGLNIFSFESVAYLLLYSFGKLLLFGKDILTYLEILISLIVLLSVITGYGINTLPFVIYYIYKVIMSFIN